MEHLITPAARLAAPTGARVVRPSRRQRLETPAAFHDRRWFTLAVLCVSLLVIVIDNTIVNVALPTLQNDLGTSITGLQWVVDAYTLVFAGFLLTFGALGDRFGRKGALNIGLVVFALASTAAAFANGVNELVGARAVMGLGAALIMPATLSIITNVFTDARERAVAIGIWSGVAGMAIALGPVAGGFLLEHFWWGSVFIVNVPIVAGALIAGRFLVPNSRSPEARPIDVAGAVLSVVGLLALVWGIIEAPSKGWTSTPILVAFTVAIVALASFIAWERRTEHPMLNVQFFRNPRFTAASLTVTLVFFALIGFVFLATQYLQFVLGYSPLQAGIRTLPFALAMMVVAPMSSKFVEWLGTKRIVVAGMLVFATGMVVASTSTVTSGYPRVAIAMLLLGSGMGLALAPSTESIMGALPRNEAGVGSAVNDTSREVGAALGIAVIGSMLSSIYGSQFAEHAPAALPAAARHAADNSLGAALQVSGQLGGAGATIAQVAKEAFVYAMSRASLVTAAIAVVGALVAWRFLPARAADEDVVDVIELTEVADVVELPRERERDRERQPVPVPVPVSVRPVGQLTPVPPRPQ